MGIENSRTCSSGAEEKQKAMESWISSGKANTSDKRQCGVRDTKILRVQEVQDRSGSEIRTTKSWAHQMMPSHPW